MGNLTGRYVDASQTDVRPEAKIGDDESRRPVRRPRSRVPVPDDGHPSYVGRKNRLRVSKAEAPSGEPVKALSSKAKRGRPRIEDRDKTIEARKPWLALGMGRRTWYDRKAKGELK